MAPKITVEAVYREGNFHIITIDRGEVTFGRANDNAVIVDGDSISRHHGLLKCINNHWIYTDCGSLNGSFYNEKPLQAGKITLLKNGDVIRLACFSFRVLISESIVDETLPSVIAFRGDNYFAEYVVEDNYGIVIANDKFDLQPVDQIKKSGTLLLGNELGNFWAYPAEDLGIITVNSTAIRKRVRLRHNDEVGWSEGKLVVIEPRQISADSGSLPRVRNMPEDIDTHGQYADEVEESSSPIFDPGDTVIIKSQSVKNNLTKVYLGGSDLDSNKSQLNIRGELGRDKNITRTFSLDNSRFLTKQILNVQNLLRKFKEIVWRKP